MPEDIHGQRHASAGVALLLLCIAVLIGVTFAVRSIRVRSPASHRARALLSLDAALDATLEPLDPTSARLLGGGSQVDDMVVTSVANRGRAARAGIRVGDVVEEIGGKDPSDFDGAVAVLGPAAATVIINRHGQHAVVQLPARSANG
jgi:S1-C subfamily serine protease